MDQTHKLTQQSFSLPPSAPGGCKPALPDVYLFPSLTPGNCLVNIILSLLFILHYITLSKANKIEKNMKANSSVNLAEF